MLFFYRGTVSFLKGYVQSFVAGLQVVSWKPNIQMEDRQLSHIGP